jgi:hypothetical protein
MVNFYVAIAENKRTQAHEKTKWNQSAWFMNGLHPVWQHIFMWIMSLCTMDFPSGFCYSLVHIHVKLDVRGSVHHSIIHIENPTRCKSVSKFYFIFIWSSTCFGRHTAHYQEPKTALVASGSAYVGGCWTCRCWTLTASRRGTDSQSTKYCVITTSHVDVWEFLLGWIKKQHSGVV